MMSRLTDQSLAISDNFVFSFCTFDFPLLFEEMDLQHFPHTDGVCPYLQ